MTEGRQVIDEDRDGGLRWTLYVDDEEIIRRIGIPRRLGRMVIRSLEEKGGFPPKQKLWGDRRYWPSVRAYLDRMNEPSYPANRRG